MVDGSCRAARPPSCGRVVRQAAAAARREESRRIVAEADWLEAKRSRIVDSLRALSPDIDDSIVVNGNGEAEPDELPRALSPARRERGR
jgi:hypothetical protein